MKGIGIGWEGGWGETSSGRGWNKAHSSRKKSYRKPTLPQLIIRQEIHGPFMLRAALTEIVVVSVPQVATQDSTLERVELNLTKELLVHDRRE